MFQLSIEFLCLLNNRAPRPLGRIPVGHRELPLWPGHVLSGLPPFRPAWLTRPHELQASELAGSGLPSGGSDKSCGCGGAGWGRLCFGRARAPGCPVPGHHHAQWLLPFNHRLLTTDGLLWSRQSLREVLRWCLFMEKAGSARTGQAMPRAAQLGKVRAGAQMGSSEPRRDLPRDARLPPQSCLWAAG